MIFCVEDDDSIRELMIYTLNMAGLEAAGFPEGESFWKALKQETPQLVLLDIMLPGEDGIAILKKLRRQKETRDIPVIMATARGTEYDKVYGLDLGADDYLVKPFGMMEMVSRIKAVLRRTLPKENTKCLKAGGLELDIEQHSVKVSEKKVELTHKEYELLRILMEHPGKVFTRDQLLNTVWNSDYAGETRTVDVHIASLRTKLGEVGEKIKTVRGVGYRMEGEA